MQERDRTLLFDFDGTVSLGSGPVLAYARAAAASLSDGTAFLAEVERALGEHPSGRVPERASIDGYDLVRILSSEHGIDTGVLGDAYLASREHLATPLAPVLAPDGLAAFLDRARHYAYLVVATNAPETRFEAALEVLGLGGLFDATYTAVSKPSGLSRVLDEWMPRGALLSIGDVWANDLAPAQARGALTALIGPAADEAADVTPTFRAEHLHELYPVIADWLETLHPSTYSTTIERHAK